MTDLTAHETGLLDGEAGPGVSLAMRVVVTLARALRAARLRQVSSAHVDSCLYHGRSSFDFVDALAAGSARVAVPTTLNVGGIDLNRPGSFRGAAADGRDAAALMERYVELGCQPTFTCAPYQLPGRPGYGEHVAWAESNAIVFGNSVIGLRTGRYGDFLDICAAVAGRVPDAGLHVERNRAARVVFSVEPDLPGAFAPELLAALLGHHVGRATGEQVPAVVGLDPGRVDEDWLKAFGAAAASSGGVALFHVVGVTPDAPDVDTATHGQPPTRTEPVGVDDLRRARRALSTAAPGDPLGGVSLGTPHMSRPQLRAVAAQLDGRRVTAPMYVSTSRSVVHHEPDAVAVLERSGVRIVTDTCTYVAKLMEPAGAVMTDSAKWAYYAPANLGMDVLLASRVECVESAVSGAVVLRDAL